MVTRAFTPCAVFAVLCILAAPAAHRAALQAQSPGISIEHTGTDTLRLNPGGRGSVPVLIQNSGQTARTVRGSVLPPGGWRGLIGVGDQPLPPGSQVLRIATFIVPDDAPAGLYVVLVQAAEASDSVYVRVAEQPQLEVAVEQTPEWVSAGSTYSVRFRVTNTGNVASIVHLQLESSGAVRVRADTTAAELRPGSSHVIVADVTTRADLTLSATSAVTLRARSAEIMAHAAARVDVVPLGRTQSVSTRGGIPGQFRVRLSDDDGAGAPLRIHAAGPVRPGSATQFELLLNGPTRGYSVFGEPDVYRLSLITPDYMLLAGDHVYSLSPLTEPAREGLGVEGRARAGPFEAGAYVQRDRRSALPDSQAAGFVGVRLGGALTARANWLYDTGRGTPRSIYSGQTTLDLREWLSLDAEYGVRPTFTARAYAIGARAGGRVLSMNLRRIRGDTAFGGLYGGIALDAAHIILQPWTGVFVDGSVDEQTLRRTRLSTVHTQTFSTQRLALRFGSRLSLEGRRATHAATHGTAGQDRESQSARMRIGFRAGRLLVAPSAEVGRMLRPGELDRAFWKSALQTQLLLPIGTVAGFVEYAQGATLYGAFEERVLAASLSASLNLTRADALDVAAYGTRHSGAGRYRISLVSNASLEHEFANGHRLALRARSRLLTGLFEQQETLVLLDYVLPFTIPTSSRSAGGARVVARVFDVLTNQPLAGVVVLLGDRRVVTDARGIVAFANVEAGHHSLRVDRASMGLARVPSVPMPVPVMLTAGEVREIELPLTAAAAIAVEVMRAAPTSLRGAPPSEGDEGAVPEQGIAVSFVRADQQLRRTTDELGRISLSDLRPGRWSIRPATGQLPAFHRFEPDSIALDLQPASSQTIAFTIAPTARRLQIVASAEVREEVRVVDDTTAVAPQREPVAAAERQPAGRPVAAPTPPVRRRPAPAVARVPSEPRLPPGWSTFVVEGSVTTLMEVARQVYFQTYLWPKIWRANRASVPNPANVPAGLVLRVPPRAPLTPAEIRLEHEYYQGRRP